MLNLLTRFSALTLISTLLSNCAPDTSDTPADSTMAATSTLTKRTIGTAADSLNGIPGHSFGEPLRNVPGLVLYDEDNEAGVRGYLMSLDQQRVWFGEHAEQFAIYCQFQDGRFSMFCALATGLEGSPTARRQQLLSLFGPGKDPLDLRGRVNWEGERVRVRVRVMPSKNPASSGTCWVEVHSKPLLAVQQAKRHAYFQALAARRHF